MSYPVLVAFSSRYGSTRQVADAVAAALREQGLEVDLTHMRKTRTLNGYRAIVLGAPLYIGHWHKDARRFLERHRDALTGRPVAVFALGPTKNPRDDNEWLACRAMLEKELAAFPWLSPVALELCGGAYDPAHLRFPDSLIASLPASPGHGAPASDARDWKAIHAWVKNLAARLQPASQ